MPLSSAASGRMTALALGASQRFAMWAISAKPKDDPEEGTDVVGDLRLLTERGDDVERDDQQRAEEEQSQLCTALRLRAELVTQKRCTTGP